MTQLALNAKVSDTIRITSFFANFGKESNLFGTERKNMTAQAAIERVETLKQIHENIKNMQQKFAIYQNKKRKTTSQLKERDKIYLLTKNLKINRPSRKLDHVKIGPFFIKKVKERNNYELELSKNAKVHPVFHISLLKPADPKTPIQKTFHYQVQEEDEFEVEKILDEKDQRNLIKWKGYPTSENCWEPLKNLTNCRELLRARSRIRNDLLNFTGPLQLLQPFEFLHLRETFVEKSLLMIFEKFLLFAQSTDLRLRLTKLFGRHTRGSLRRDLLLFQPFHRTINFGEIHRSRLNGNTFSTSENTLRTFQRQGRKFAFEPFAFATTTRHHGERTVSIDTGG